jgi:hypothetical protein
VLLYCVWFRRAAVLKPISLGPAEAADDAPLPAGLLAPVALDAPVPLLDDGVPDEAYADEPAPEEEGAPGDEPGAPSPIWPVEHPSASAVQRQHPKARAARFARGMTGLQTLAASQVPI